MTEMMQATQIYKYGSPEVFQYEEIARPAPAAGEVLVRVKAAGVNPVDWKTRSGRGLAGLYGSDRFPLIVGWDISGVVEALGDRASGLEVGDAVFGMPAFPEVAAAYAEYATARPSELALKPESIDHIHAAAMPLVALTAWQSLFEAAELQPEQKILIHAAAGGVGHIAVQLAKWKNAFVIGTASARNEEYLASIGVDQFVDYQKTPFEEVVSDVDVVLDTLSGDVRERSWSVLKPGGILVSILGEPSAESAAQHNVRATSILVRPEGQQMAAISALVDQNILKPHVDKSYPLAAAAQAHIHVHKGHTRGKVVLTTA